MDLALPVRENLELRAPRPADAQAFFDIVRKNDLHLRRWLPWLDEDKAVGDTEAYIKGSVERYSRREGLDLLIWLDGTLVGGIGFDPWDMGHKKASIAYWLAEDSQGKGIMSDSLKVAIAYAFSSMGLNRLEIRCAVGNEKSAALPKKLGFTYEGILRQGEWLYDRFVDMEVYSLLAEEWRIQSRT